MLKIASVLIGLKFCDLSSVLLSQLLEYLKGDVKIQTIQNIVCYGIGNVLLNQTAKHQLCILVHLQV